MVPEPWKYTKGYKYMIIWDRKSPRCNKYVHAIGNHRWSPRARGRPPLAPGTYMYIISQHSGNNAQKKRLKIQGWGGPRPPLICHHAHQLFVNLDRGSVRLSKSVRTHDNIWKWYILYAHIIFSGRTILEFSGLTHALYASTTLLSTS